MTRSTLAIPVIALLTFSISFPACAQTTPASASVKDTPPAVAAPSPTLSEEETGRLYLIRKDYHEAEIVFRQLTQEQPKNPIYWNELGITLQNQTRLGGALKCYEKSVKVDPSYPDAQNNIGTIWYERKKYAKAIRAYKKAITIREDFAAFHLNLGFAYFGEEHYEESIASFRRALQIDPSSFDSSHSHTGTVVQDRSLSSDRGRFYYLLAKSFAQSGNLERCVIYLKKSRDEGYKDFNNVKSDPAFSAVLNEPAVQELLVAKPADIAQP